MHKIGQISPKDGMVMDLGQPPKEHTTMWRDPRHEAKGKKSASIGPSQKAQAWGGRRDDTDRSRTSGSGWAGCGKSVVEPVLPLTLLG
jgi:hypothetical protein